MDFVKDFLTKMDGPVAQQLKEREGLAPEQSRSFLEGLAPLVLGGLKRKQDEGRDVEEVAQGMGADEDAVENPSSFFDGGASRSAGTGALMGLEQEEQAASALAQKSGISVDVARRLLPMLAPLVVGYLMKKGREDSKTSTRRGGMSAILDRDGDGKILDDIAGFVIAKQLGGKRGGFLAMLFAFFRGRR